MKSIVAYVKNILGFVDEDPGSKLSSKRYRDDDLSSDDEAPAYKRLRQLKRSSYPDVMTPRDDPNKKVRYIPIHVEDGYPSTSTPNNNRRNVFQLLDLTKNDDNPPQNRRTNTSSRPVLHTVIDDDPEIQWEERKPEKTQKKVPKFYINVDDDEQEKAQKKPPKFYVNIEDDDDDDDEDCENDQDDVIYVRKIEKPPPKKPETTYKYFVSKNKEYSSEARNDSMPTHVKLIREPNNRHSSNISPKPHSKFRDPPGIYKPYKRSPVPLPRWFSSLAPHQPKVNNGQPNQNGRSTLAEIFNLDEKRNYQELIRRVGCTASPVSLTKSKNIINLAEDSSLLRSTQKSQRRALNDLKLVEKEMSLENESDGLKRYHPLTIASISSDSDVEIVPSEASTTSSVRIDPLNSLRDSYRNNAVTRDDWLSGLGTKYKQKREQAQERLTEMRLESDIISKVNAKQKLALLEHKLKYSLVIPESLFEDVPVAEELPKLTEQQERLVRAALGPGPPGELLVEKFNLRIHRRDLQTLAGLNWLNDEVINFYMNLLMQRSEERPDLPRVYAANTFFYPKLMQSGQAGLRRWTRKVDIFSHTLVAVPVHMGVHWCMALVDMKARRVAYLDSMGGRNQRCVDALLQYLRDEHQDKKGTPFDDSGWTTVCLKDIPQQMNGSDCGMFACTFAEYSARAAPYTFSQADMPLLRRKAALEILQGRLLL